VKQETGTQDELSKQGRAFTSRELQVMSLLGQGKTTKEIASGLNIGTGTVGAHRKSICRKLGVHSTVELIYQVMLIKSHGMIRVSTS
jgi:DNA-binding NarL/FixJ family response regulator